MHYYSNSNTKIRHTHVCMLIYSSSMMLSVLKKILNEIMFTQLLMMD